MRHWIGVPAILAVVTLSFAQETTETAVNESVTSGRSAVVRKIGFERRWKSIEAIYAKAGLGEEKVGKLKNLDFLAFEDLQKGKKPDFAALQAERRKILTTEDEAKLETVRKEQLKERKVPSDDKKTTSGAQNQE